MSASNINEERNQVTVELSDINGSFENPITISATPKLTDESGIITAVLPDQLHSGIYKVMRSHLIFNTTTTYSALNLS